MLLINIVFLQLPAKEGFLVIQVICHESVIYVMGHVSHTSEAQCLLPRVTRQTETFLMAPIFRCVMPVIFSVTFALLWVLPTKNHLFEISTRLLPDSSLLTLGAVLMCTDVHTRDRLVDCRNSYTLWSFMLMNAIFHL